MPKAKVDHTISGQCTAINTLDHSATTPILPLPEEAMDPFHSDRWQSLFYHDSQFEPFMMTHDISLLSWHSTPLYHAIYFILLLWVWDRSCYNDRRHPMTFMSYRTFLILHISCSCILFSSSCISPRKINWNCKY